MREGDGNCVLCLLGEGELSDTASSPKVLVLSSPLTHLTAKGIASSPRKGAVGVVAFTKTRMSRIS